MGGSYKRCSGCGGRALSIATRCPGCGGEFPVAEEADGRPARKVGWSISLSMPVVVLAGAGIVVVSQIGRTASPREQRSSFGAAAPEIATHSAPSAAASGTMAPSVAADAPPEATVLVAQRMVYLRKARSGSSALEAVLEAGDTLAVDSLVGGWYRVTFEGAVMGYAIESSVVGRGS